MENLTPKQRMLNAYRGPQNDRFAVAPEFWCYYPAKVLDVPMIEFEREIPFWKSLKSVFERYDCEGWGIFIPSFQNENLETNVVLNGYEETTSYDYCGKHFEVKKMYDQAESCWQTKHLATEETLSDVIDMLLDPKNVYDFHAARQAHEAVGESYLLELWMGMPFFDFVAELIGFENAVLYFVDEDKAVLRSYRERYTQYQKEFIKQAAEQTDYESFMMGCSYSCNSLIGQQMWRKWDKPYIKEITDTVHQYQKLIHIHFHGKSIETAEDFAQIGLDCVCPFERGPGGDVTTRDDLKYVRCALDDKVTFNGNVHTVESLIRGDEKKVRSEVRQIKEVFAASNRIIIGTGDQVGRETPEENIIAMIEEAKR